MGQDRIHPNQSEPPYPRHVIKNTMGVSSERVSGCLRKDSGWTVRNDQKAKYLGRGVCYALNVLACELLRRVDVPAAVAVGWTMDRGQVSDPDHLWALALLPSTAGSKWFPIDSATTRDGRSVEP